jgi:hypothetical protein
VVLVVENEAATRTEFNHSATIVAVSFKKWIAVFSGNMKRELSERTDIAEKDVMGMRSDGEQPAIIFRNRKFDDRT